MSWTVHSSYFGWQIEREYDDIKNRPKMSYRATVGGWKDTPLREVTAKNLDGIKWAVREAMKDEEGQ